MQPPTVIVLNATALNISWEAPISPNGVIESYTLKLPTPRIEIRDPQQTYHVVYNLIPYTQYFVSVIACTGMWSPRQFAMFQGTPHAKHMTGDLKLLWSIY